MVRTTWCFSRCATASRCVITTFSPGLSNLRHVSCFVNWRCLRTSYGTWLKRHGADMKDIQGQMRHSRISTTMDIYVQDIPESRRRAVEKLPAPATVQ